MTDATTSRAKERVAAVDGWFTLDADQPRLLGNRCTTCGTFFFPRAEFFCRNPECDGTAFDEVPLSSKGGCGPTPSTATSPRLPIVSADPFVPYAIAAVELVEEKMVVLGQMVAGVEGDQLDVGMEVELVLDTLYEDDDHEYLVWKWRPVAPSERRSVLMSNDVAILGVGMHPWGKWGRNFVEYGITAARDALADAGVAWTDIQYVSGADTIRNGYPGLHRRRHASPRPSAGRAPGSRRATPPARRAPTPSTRPGPRSSPACATSPSWWAPTPRRRGSSPPSVATARTTRTGCASGCSAPPTRRYFALYARRRMELYGATDADFAQVKVKNARHGLANPNARYRKEVTDRRGARLADRRRPAAPARDLRHERRRRRPRALQHGLRPPPGRRARRCGSARCRRSRPRYPEHRDRDAQLRHRLGGGGRPGRSSPSATRSPAAAYEEAGIGP